MEFSKEFREQYSNNMDNCFLQWEWITEDWEPIYKLSFNHKDCDYLGIFNLSL